MQSHTRYSYVDNSVLTVQLPEHCTCKTKHHFPYTIVLAPTWTKRAPRKWIQFTWKRNDSNHEFHLDTETVDSQLFSSKYSYDNKKNKKINHQPTDWWLLTNPFLWWLMDILWLWCNHNNVMQLLSEAGAAYSSGTAMVVPVFLLNNRYQF